MIRRHEALKMLMILGGQDKVTPEMYDRPEFTADAIYKDWEDYVMDAEPREREAEFAKRLAKFGR